MGRIRTIKPEFHTHEELSELPPETHLLAAALLNYADDEGYFNANPVLVKAGTNPLRSDRTAVAGQLKQLEGIGYIKIVRKGNKQIGLVVEFEKHQRVSHATPSKLKSTFEELQRNSGEPPEPLRPEQGIELKGTGNREATTANADGALLRPVINLPLTSGNTHPITEVDVGLWQPAYPAVDVRGELRKIASWLDAHPEKRSVNVQGSKQRIVKWLTRAQNNGGINGNAGFKSKDQRTLDALTASLAGDDQSRTDQAGDFATGGVIEGGAGPVLHGVAELGHGGPASSSEVIRAAQRGR